MGIPRELFDMSPLWAITEPAERIRAAHALIAEANDLSAAAAAVTRETVQQMRRSGMSLAEVAAELGVTRGRVQQLEKSRTSS